MKIRPQPLPVLDAHLEAELFEGVAPAKLRPDHKAALRDRVVEAIGGARVGAARGQDFVTVHQAEGEWRRIGPRILEKRLVEASGVYASIVRLEAGATIPPHDHPTAEESLVLEGEVWLGDVFCRAGDFHFAPAGRRHGAIRTETGCLLYVRTGGGKGAPLL